MVILGTGVAAHGQATISEPNGATDVTVYFRAYDKTTGDPNTSAIVTDYTPCYLIAGSAMVVPDTNLAALSTAADAHTDDKAYHVGQGLVRWDVNDTPFTGAPGTRVILLLVDDTGEDRFDPPFLIVELNPPVDVNLWGKAAVPALGTIVDLKTVLDAKLPTDCNTLTVDPNGNLEVVIVALSDAAGLTTSEYATVEAAVLAVLNSYDPPTKAELDTAVSPLGTSLEIAAVQAVVDDANDQADAIYGVVSDGTYGLSALYDWVRKIFRELP